MYVNDPTHVNDPTLYKMYVNDPTLYNVCEWSNPL